MISSLSYQRGFTLLEIMVVVVLIGLGVTLITLNLERDVDQVADLEARRFASLIEYLRDESILTGRLYAVEVDEAEKRYQFLIYDKEWVTVNRDDVLRQRVIPEYLGLRFSAPDDLKNRLVVDSLGELTEFELTILGDETDYIVTLDDAQNIEVQRKKREAG